MGILADTARSTQVLSFLMEGAQELLGLESLQHALKALENGTARETGVAKDDLSVEDCSQLPRALEKQFGLVGGRGLAVRIGRSAFKYLLQQQGDALGFSSVDFRLQRAPRRMQEGLHILAQHLGQTSGDRIAIGNEDRYWVWRSERCPVCWGRKSNDASCYLTVGLLQEFLTWSGGGRYYRVRETDCRAVGDSACIFQIEKMALE